MLSIKLTDTAPQVRGEFKMAATSAVKKCYNIWKDLPPLPEGSDETNSPERIQKIIDRVAKLLDHDCFVRENAGTSKAISSKFLSPLTDLFL